MAQVYASCFQAIKPGGVIVVVVKDYVKKGKRVPLCDDTVRLLEHTGFTMVERIHAMLVKETRHADLFNGHTTSKVSRKSFFRRLAESKGSPEINFEEVLIARK
jgi:DNA modification methylase